MGVWREEPQRSTWPPPLSRVLYRARTVRRCRSPKIRMRSVSSGFCRPHESFGEAVRSRTPRRNLYGVDARAGQDGIERRGELTSAVADEEPEPGGMVAEVHQEVAGLLGGPRSSSVTGRPEDVHVAAVDFQGEEDVDPFEGDCAVDVEEVHGQHGRGLGPEELTPGRVRGSERRGR
jgi:hypothetical protein